MFIKKSHIALIHDTLAAACSFLFALYLRLGDEVFTNIEHFLPAIITFTTISTLVFYLLGLYRGVWRYASLQDLLGIIRAATLATLIFLAFFFMTTRLENFPRSVLIINYIVLLLALGGPRMLYRILKDKNFSPLSFLEDNTSDRITVLLLGVSDNAVNFINATNKRSNMSYKVVGIVDDNKENIGRQIHGVKVFGDFTQVPRIIRKLKKQHKAPRRIILARDDIQGPIIKELLKITDTLGFSLAKLPKMSDFKEDIDKIDIRPVAIEDLLGRAQKAPDLGRRRQLIADKIVLVTGAGGTIGSELVRQIAAYNPKKLILFEASEFNLYKIDQELRNLIEETPNSSHILVNSVIGDVRDRNALETVFIEHKPEIVFHAAALKHVPIVEENISEAVLTNILGSKNVLDLSAKYEAKKTVLVSTDKAVNPSSFMGKTKRAAECYLQALASSADNKNTAFAIVRFGNVLGSSGSVIPLFTEQLKKGGPITVTHPEMKRYFMTVTEAVELVLQASTIPESEQKSAIFVLDMGEPMFIKDLALEMIKLAGLKLDEDIEIKYTGIRPGEKLYEELFYQHEKPQKTNFQGINLADPGNNDNKYILTMIENILQHALKRDESKLTKLVDELCTKCSTSQ